jgi:hypothetical protein
MGAGGRWKRQSESIRYRNTENCFWQNNSKTIKAQIDKLKVVFHQKLMKV